MVWLRIEGLGVAIACFGLGWVIVRLLRLTGWEARWTGRGNVAFRRVGDERPDGAGTHFGIGQGTDVHTGPLGGPDGSGGASGGF